MARKKKNARLAKLVARNNERRAEGEVFRVETLFYAKDNRQAEMAKFLGELPRGGASEFVRQAVWEKMMRDEMGIDAVQQDSFEVQQFNAYIREEFDAIHARLDGLPQRGYFEDRFMDVGDQCSSIQRAVQTTIRESIQGLRLSARERVTEREIVLETQPATVASSGIDMSRPRPRKAPRTVAPPPTLPEELTPEREHELRMAFVNSIKNAQIGRG